MTENQTDEQVEVEDKPKREQVLDMLKEAKWTREEIAEALDMTVASVSSQLTYLRWMGNFIIYDENKILKTVTKEEYEQWMAEKEANKKTRTASTRTPEEQAVALAKTIKTQTKQLANWEEKLVKIQKDLQDMPDDEELLEMLDEANANITLLKIKLRRNKVKQDELPAITTDEEEELDEANEEDEDEEETELL